MLLSYKSIISSNKKRSIIDMIFYRAQITKNHINCEKKKKFRENCDKYRLTVIIFSSWKKLCTWIS